MLLIIGLQGKCNGGRGRYDKSEGEGRVRCATKFVVTVLVRQGTICQLPYPEKVRCWVRCATELNIARCTLRG